MVAVLKKLYAANYSVSLRTLPNRMYKLIKVIKLRPWSPLVSYKRFLVWVI